MQLKEPVPRRSLESARRDGYLEDGNRLLFVGGAPRSGTTFAQNVLDSHPEIFGTPELLHLPDLLGVRSLLLSSVERQLIDLFCDQSTVDRATYGFVEQILGPVVAASDARFVSEKTPSNALVFPQLRELFPEARFIFVIRDPRAVVSSMLEVGRRAREMDRGAPEFTRDVRVAIRSIREHLTAGFEFSRSEPDRCFVLRFEDLAARPAATTRDLCDFLDLPWTSSMIAPHKLPHAGERAITMDGVWYDRSSFNRGPDATRVDAWATELDPGHQVLATRAFSDHAGLREAGYRL
ncbi:MAG: sulfotransferase, partial [Gemmatimonadetes bacterium]|nr:sulfotransferase [Gemmatimonadota bacterium]